MLTDELLASLTDGQPHPLAPALAGWLGSSRRFASFLSANQTKVRKKLRATRDPENLRDLQLELETAFLLLRERSLSLVYEPQPGKLGRSPDFVVSYTTSLTFMVEVTRSRTPLGDSAAPMSDRFSDLLGGKWGQLAPQVGNLLVVGLETQPPGADGLRTAMLRMQQSAEANDAAVIQRSGLRDRSEYFQHYYRLSGILLRRATLQPGDPITWWDNPQARYPLPSRVRTTLMRSHSIKAA
jgi:hypothetical protein